MRLKKAWIVLLSIAIAVNMLSIFTSAEDLQPIIYDEIIEEYQIADKIDTVLGISGSTATYTSNASGNSISITVTHTLQKHWGLWIWDDVAGTTASKTVNSNNIYLRSTKSGLDSGTYRVKSTFTLTNSTGQTEVLTIYSSEKTVS